MTRRTELTLAMASSVALPDQGQAPDWIHLLPTSAGGIQTRNGLGPYTINDPAEVIRLSLANERGMPIDENHATDLAAPKGGPAPARGWIAELESRADGIWGRIDWTEAGRALLSDRAYRGISPVITHTKDGRIVQILRASLTNTPNLMGLTPILNQETPMTMARLAEKLGLAAEATEDAILGAIGKLQEPQTALQSEITALGTAFGVTGDTAAILTGVTAKASGQPAEIVALQSEIATLTTRLNEAATATKREKAEAFVDGAIKAGRAGVKPSRDRFIAMHMENAANAEAVINGMPILSGAITPPTPPVDAQGVQTALNSEQAAVARMLGVTDKDYLAQLKAEQETRA
jgi:phage I-like protein